MTTILFPVILRRPPKAVDEESKNNSTFFLSFWGIRQRRLTKNLKTIFIFMRFFIPLRSIQNDYIILSCHSEEFHRKVDDKESKIFLSCSLRFFFAFGESEWQFQFSSVILRCPADRRTTKNLKTILLLSVILRRPPKADDEESKNNFTSFCHSEEFAERRMTKNLKTIFIFMRFFIPLRSIQNDYISHIMHVKLISRRFRRFTRIISVYSTLTIFFFFHFYFANFDP